MKSTSILGVLLVVAGCSTPTARDAALDAEATPDATLDVDADRGALAADGATDALAADAAREPLRECWPWEPPSAAALRVARRKVFAHYFSQFPISIDNAPADGDYYALGYLAPEGEGGMHASYGGFLRERPLPRAPYSNEIDWQRADVATEIRRAQAAGITGFAFDILDLGEGSYHRQRLVRLLDVARAEAPDFRILLVPDMTSAFTGDDGTALARLEQMMVDFGEHPSVQRTDDGRVVLAVFAADLRSGVFWTSALRRLAAIGHPAALMPMPVGSFASVAPSFAGVELFGAASWGGRTVSFAPALREEARIARAAGLVYMAPVAPQDARPKPLVFTEANNSAAFRAQWEAAIASSADWAQVITWNDYSECTEVSPSSKTRTAFYDLTAYYAAWFITGSAPRIARDGLYYFHRAHSMDPMIAPPSARQARAMTPQAGTPTSDEVELVAFLTAPGTLEIELGGRVHTRDAPQGVIAFSVPLAPGRPVFRLRRAGALVVELTSSTTIDNAIVYQDPLYHGGASLTCPVP